MSLERGVPTSAQPASVGVQMSILASVWPCETDREHGIHSRRIGELGTNGAPALSWYVCQSGLNHEVEAISFVRHAVRVPLGGISKVALRSVPVPSISMPSEVSCRDERPRPGTRAYLQLGQDRVRPTE